MKVLVCGGRDYIDYAKICMALDKANAQRQITLLINGDAHGADRLARDWAFSRDIPRIAYPADWGKHGEAAGPIRNQHMLDDAKPDGVIAFPGGKGTADMIRRAMASGLRVWKPYG